MANRPITILGIDPNSFSLILSDRGNTSVDPGDTVTWSIGPNSGVASITSIAETSGVDVFNPDPSVQPNSTSWQGTVNPAIARGSKESYTIHYTQTSGGEPRSFDPKISVNP